MLMAPVGLHLVLSPPGRGWSSAFAELNQLGYPGNLPHRCGSASASVLRYSFSCSALLLPSISKAFFLLTARLYSCGNVLFLETGSLLQQTVYGHTLTCASPSRYFSFIITHCQEYTWSTCFHQSPEHPGIHSCQNGELWDWIWRYSSGWEMQLQHGPLLTSHSSDRLPCIALPLCSPDGSSLGSKIPRFRTRLALTSSPGHTCRTQATF